MNINSVSYRNEQNYRQTPTFGAIRFTDSAMQVLKSQIINRVGNNVDSFVKEVKLLEYLKGIGTSREKCLLFAHYMEALVAYHRYYHIGNER